MHPNISRLRNFMPCVAKWAWYHLVIKTQKPDVINTPVEIVFFNYNILQKMLATRTSDSKSELNTENLNHNI